MTTYNVAFDNQTSMTWVFVVYVTIPNATGMLSVAWQLAGVAQGGTGSVSWTDDSSACLGKASTSSGAQSFSQTLSRPATANEAWSAFLNSGVVDLKLTGLSVTPGQLEITNNSGQLANLALGYGGIAAVYAAGVPSGVTAGYIPEPRYWVMLSQSIAQGQVVARAATPAKFAVAPPSMQVAGLSTPPQPLKFPGSSSSASVKASMDGQAVLVTITYP